MSLASLTIWLSGAGIMVTGLLAVLFLRDPVKAMVQVTHRPESLPKIMGGRYVGFFLFAVGATLLGDLRVIAWMFAVFAFVSFYDTWIYARDGHPFAKHLQAGIASLIVLAVALAALWGQG